MCVDPERDLLCVYAQNQGNGEDKVNVYKIRYYFDSAAYTLTSGKSGVESHEHAWKQITQGENSDDRCESVQSYEKGGSKACNKVDGCVLA